MHRAEPSGASRFQSGLSEDDVDIVWHRVQRARQQRLMRRQAVRVVGGAMAIALMVWALAWSPPPAALTFEGVALKEGQVISLGTSPVQLSDGSQLSSPTGASLEFVHSEPGQILATLRSGKMRVQTTAKAAARWQLVTPLASVEWVVASCTVAAEQTRLSIVVDEGSVVVRGELVPNRLKRLGAGQQLSFAALPETATSIPSLTTVPPPKETEVAARAQTPSEHHEALPAPLATSPETSPKVKAPGPRRSRQAPWPAHTQEVVPSPAREREFQAEVEMAPQPRQPREEPTVVAPLSLQQRLDAVEEAVQSKNLARVDSLLEEGVRLAPGGSARATIQLEWVQARARLGAVAQALALVEAVQPQGLSPELQQAFEVERLRLLVRQGQLSRVQLLAREHLERWPASLWRSEVSAWAQ